MLMTKAKIPKSGSKGEKIMDSISRNVKQNPSFPDRLWTQTITENMNLKGFLCFSLSFETLQSKNHLRNAKDKSP